MFCTSTDAALTLKMMLLARRLVSQCSDPWWSLCHLLHDQCSTATGHGPAVGQAVPVVTPTLPQSRERFLYCSKITSIPKFGVHGDVLEGTQPSLLTQSHTVTHPCRPGHIPVPRHHSTPVPWAQGAARDAQSTPQQSGGKGGAGLGLASLEARTASPGLISITAAPAHFHGNACGDTDAIPCHATVPPACGPEGTPGMFGPGRVYRDRDAPAAAEPEDVLVGPGRRDGQDGAAPHTRVGDGSFLWTMESCKEG